MLSALVSQSALKKEEPRPIQNVDLDKLLSEPGPVKKKSEPKHTKPEQKQKSQYLDITEEAKVDLEREAMKKKAIMAKLEEKDKSKDKRLSKESGSGQTKTSSSVSGKSQEQVKSSPNVKKESKDPKMDERRKLLLEMSRNWEEYMDDPAKLELMNNLAAAERTKIEKKQDFSSKSDSTLKTKKISDSDKSSSLKASKANPFEDVIKAKMQQKLGKNGSTGTSLKDKPIEKKKISSEGHSKSSSSVMKKDVMTLNEKLKAGKLEEKRSGDKGSDKKRLEEKIRRELEEKYRKKYEAELKSKLSSSKPTSSDSRSKPSGSDMKSKSSSSLKDDPIKRKDGVSKPDSSKDKKYNPLDSRISSSKDKPKSLQNGDRDKHRDRERERERSDKDRHRDRDRERHREKEKHHKEHRREVIVKESTEYDPLSYIASKTDEPPEVKKRREALGGLLAKTKKDDDKKKKVIYEYSDEDSYESSFIDDDENDVKARRFVEKMFAGHKKKYRKVDDDESDIEEAKFDDIIEEEEISAKIGELEDRRELKNILEEEERERMRIKKKMA